MYHVHDIKILENIPGCVLVAPGTAQVHRTDTRIFSGHIQYQLHHFLLCPHLFSLLFVCTVFSKYQLRKNLSPLLKVPENSVACRCWRKHTAVSSSCHLFRLPNCLFQVMNQNQPFFVCKRRPFFLNLFINPSAGFFHEDDIRHTGGRKVSNQITVVNPPVHPANEHCIGIRKGFQRLNRGITNGGNRIIVITDSV